MKVYLYGGSFDITEANICEGRGKYLVRSSLNNADKFIKSECEKCRSVSEMTQKVPQITGALILNLTQHILYNLQLEGISTNAKEYLDSVFGVKGSVCQKVCQTLNAHARELENASDSRRREIPDKLTAAALMDLQNLWLGYFRAHGYSAQEEFYTHHKFNDAIREIAVLNFNRAGTSPAKVCLQALRDAPYEDSIYKTVEAQMGADKNLASYKNLFTTLFKRGTYKDMSDPNRLETLKAEIVGKIYSLCATEFKFTSYIYCNGNTTDKGVKKFNTALATYAPIEENEVPLLCLDSTAMGGAEDGAIVSTRGIYIHNYKDTPKFLHFKDIKTLTVEGLMSKNIFVDGQKIDTAGMSNSDVKRFYNLLNKIRELIAPLYEHEKKRTPTKEDIDTLILNLRGDPKFKFDSSIYIYSDEDKTKKKFKGATSSYAKLAVDEYPIVCYDGTVFGSANDGFIVTNFGVHLHNMSEDTFFFAHEKIRRLEMRSKEIFIDNKKIDMHGESNDKKQRTMDLVKRVRDYFVRF